MDPALKRQISDAYGVFVSGDTDAIAREFTLDGTFTNPPYAIEGGVRRGRDEVRASFEALHAEFQFTAAELEDLIEGPEGVVAIVHVEGHGRSSGAPLDGRFFHAFRMRDGLVADFAWFATLDEARQSIGL